MLISKFNRLIHNKVLWTIFVLVIVFAFVFSYGLSKLSSADRGPRKGAGSAEGDAVSPEELNLVLHFQNMRDLPKSDEERAESRKNAWKWIAAVRKARAMGFKVGDAELASTIRRIPAFVYQGKFNPDNYQNIVNQVYNTTTMAFEAYVKQTILIDKLRAAVSGAAWIPNVEVDEQVAAQTDAYTVNIAQTSAYTNTVEVSDEELIAFYEANTNMFVEPERVSVAYVSIPYSNYLADVEISTDEAETYYKENLDKYTTADTNGNDIVTAFTNVEQTIVSELKMTRAEKQAAAVAEEALTLMFPSRLSPGKDFWSATRDLSLAVSTTRLFAAYEWLPDFQPYAEVVEKSFELSFDTPKQSFSDMIRGDNSIYMLAPVQRVAEHVPPLEEIQPKVRQAALADKRSEIVEEKAEEAQSAIQKAIAGGASFTNAIAQQSMNMVTSVTFTVSSAQEGTNPPFQYGRRIADLMYKLNSGEFTDPIVMGNTALIVQLTDRQTGEVWAREALLERIRNMSKFGAISGLFAEWQELNLNVEDYALKDSEDETTESVPDTEDIEAQPATAESTEG